jgi:hypothetical protein
MKQSCAAAMDTKDKPCSDPDPMPADLSLICKGGRSVPAHSCLLALISAPLRPTIKLALEEEAASGTLEPAELALKDDSADTWSLALRFLDPTQFSSRPPVVWVRALPGLRCC